MKRYVCTVAVGMLLALAGAGTAAATGLPSADQTQAATQSAGFGDQSVGEQRNDADVTQAQGNGNVNVSPAIAIGGDASTSNTQGSGNTADADVDQSNEATQSQSSQQEQTLDQAGSPSCCGSTTQTGQQVVYGGEQSVGEQKNDADVDQYQGNGNVNVSPAIAVGGDATTSNAQGNDNTAAADVDQSNTATQSQSAWQRQDLSQQGSACCDRPSACTYGCKPKPDVKKDGYEKKYEKKKACCGGQSQTGEQTATFGDQSVGKQKNEADVDQYQGNGNKNVSPALAVGELKRDSCSKEWYGTCGGLVREQRRRRLHLECAGQRQPGVGGRRPVEHGDADAVGLPTPEPPPARKGGDARLGQSRARRAPARRQTQEGKGSAGRLHAGRPSHGGIQIGRARRGAVPFLRVRATIRATVVDKGGE